MKSVLIVYWSGTGNTETLAEAVAHGAQGAGAQVTLRPVAQVNPQDVGGYDTLALGCPSMGDEVLEEDEMEPFVAQLTPALVGGKPLVLFGSYDWGDGQWMRDWKGRMEALGAGLAADPVICQLNPDQESLAACHQAGAALAR